MDLFAFGLIACLILVFKFNLKFCLSRYKNIPKKNINKRNTMLFPTFGPCVSFKLFIVFIMHNMSKVTLICTRGSKKADKGVIVELKFHVYFAWSSGLHFSRDRLLAKLDTLTTRALGLSSGNKA